MTVQAVAIAPVQSRPACMHCTHFASAAVVIEAQIPGLRVMGSAYASVRGDDGICARHGRYIPAAASCCEFVARETAV